MVGNQGRPGQSRYRTKHSGVISFVDFEGILANTRSDTMASLLTVLFYTGLRIAEICGDNGRKWRVLSVFGKRILKRDGSLPSGWRKDLRLSKARHRGPASGILREDITIEGDFLHIEAPPLKHGHRKGARSPLNLHRTWPHVDLIEQQWHRTEPEKRVWPLTPTQVW